MPTHVYSIERIRHVLIFPTRACNRFEISRYRDSIVSPVDTYRYRPSIEWIYVS